MGRKRIYANAAERSRAWRARRKLAAQGRPVDRPALGTDAAALAEWAAAKLRIPPGHFRASGAPFVLEPFQQSIVDDVLRHTETLFCSARKNAKSALIAVIVLGHLLGPLRRAGWRCGVMSVNRGKAGELLQQIEEIAAASGIHVAGGRDTPTAGGLKVRRTPWPGKLIAVDTGGRVEIEGAGHASATGHSAGYDLAVIDEIGLLEERHRRMVNGMRSSLGARNGRFLALSIHGDGPFIPEILSRKGAPGLAIHHYTADEDLSLDDPVAWRQANPGLGTIKSESKMRDDAARVMDIPADEPDFQAQELNRPGSPTDEPIITPAQLQACEVPSGDLPPREGPAFVGIDLGDVASFTSVVAYWQTGRMEVYTAVGDSPQLAKRAKKDGAGSLYERARRDGHLWTLSGALTPIAPLLEKVGAALAGVHVAAVGADRRRADELQRHMVSMRLHWPRPTWRGGGVRAVLDAAHDIREFQRAVHGGIMRTVPNVLFLAAIRYAKVLRDGNGDATGLKQKTVRRRIDPLQAAVIAVGLAALRPRRQSGPTIVHVA